MTDDSIPLFHGYSRRGDDADDEQSDWPGHETSSTSVGPGGRLTLEGTGSAIYSDEEDLTNFQENMTSTARQVSKFFHDAVSSQSSQ